MNITRTLSALALSLGVFVSSCSKESEQADTAYPVIDMSVAGASPQACAELTRGQKFTFKARFTDNVNLGAYSLDIHHNFDHHNHSTEVSNCAMGAVKTAVKPLVFIREYTIPAGLQEHVATAEIDIPADVDTGDYHFLIKVTDKEGWQTISGISIKIK